MAGIFKKGIAESDNVVNFKMLSRKNAPYIFIWIIYYAWVVVYTTWWTASPLTDNVFGTDIRNMIQAVTLISSAVLVFIIKKDFFVKASRVGAVFIIAGMLVIMTVRNEYAVLVSEASIGIFLGCVNISILIPFVFALNNTEKFYAVVLSNILINVFSFLQNIKGGNIIPDTGDMALSFFILVAGLSAVLFFKKDALPAEDETPGIVKVPARIYLTLVLNCIFAILCKGIVKGILNLNAVSMDIPVLKWYYAGGILGCLLYILIYGHSRNSIHMSWNITFGTITMGLLCNGLMLSDYRIEAASSLFIGTGSSIGMINMYYMLGVIGKKYNSIRYVRFSILFIGICGGLAGIIAGNMIYNANAPYISVASSIAGSAVMIVILIISPVLSQTYYKDEWVGDTEKTEIDNEHGAMFKKYGLSRRETEVAKLLLEGYTLRQISVIISISYSTVNTYCTSIYRKLNINSRSELFILFKDYDTPLEKYTETAPH